MQKLSIELWGVCLVCRRPCIITQSDNICAFEWDKRITCDWFSETALLLKLSKED